MFLPFAPITINLAAVRQAPSINDFLKHVNNDLTVGDAADLKSRFIHPDDTGYLFEMAGTLGGIPKLKAVALPTPPGWEGYGQYWIVFTHWHDVELSSDAVYEVHIKGDQFQIGQEVKEDFLGGWRIENVSYTAVLHPSAGSVDVSVDMKIHAGAAERALPFRLNPGIDPKSTADRPVLVETPDAVQTPVPGMLVRAGMLCIPWTSKPEPEIKFDYSVKPPAGEEDSITDDHAYVTANWIPSLGRLPFTVQATVTGPKGWKIRCEGTLSSRTEQGAEQTVSYSCPLAIAFPKIIAGKYTLMATDRHKGQTFNVWQISPTDKTRAERDLKAMERAADYFQSILGPLPFPGYSLYDSQNYYGIESYSHTLLQRDVTHFVTHEMGHSYFGGIVPCSYVNDAWNEGLTEYLDSVLLNDDRDHSLEMAQSSLNVTVPLSQMRICWDYSNAAYMRGCYVMKMLEAVIGKKNVVKGLGLLVQDRRGVPTNWDDLREYFEKSSGQNLGWFWSQWIDNGVFPKLKMISYKSEPSGDGWKTTVVIEQSGTELPFRMKFGLTAQVDGTDLPMTVDMTAPQQQYEIMTKQKPTLVKIETFPLTLAHVESPSP